MANINVDDSLNSFIQKQVSSGRYQNESDVVNHALQEMAAKQAKLETLQRHLLEGEQQALSGEFVEQSMEDMLSEFKRNYAKSNGL